MPEAVWTRVAAYVVCRDDDGRLLLTRFFWDGHPDSGHWTMPGGGMEWGETLVETAARELEEETGLTADIGRLLGVYNRWREAHETFSGEPGHMVGLLFEGTNVRGDLRHDFLGTTDAAGWFTLDEVRDLRRGEVLDLVLDLL